MQSWASDAVRAVLEKPILVLGCGSIGRRHIKNLLVLGAKDVHSFDTWGYPDFDQITGHGSLTEALAVHPIAAIICTPTRSHTEHIDDCLKHGIANIFVEKPLFDGWWQETRFDWPAIDKANTFVACNFRFTPGLQRVKQLIDDGAIGKVVSARAQFGQYLPDMRPGVDHKKIYAANKSMGGGCLLDGIHEFDYLSWLLGPIAEAKAFTARLTDVTVDTEDVAEVILRFESGALGSVHEDYVRRGYNRFLEVIGELGRITWDFQKDGGWTVGVDAPYQVGGYMSPYRRDQVNDMYLAQMQHFLRVCAGEEKSMNTVADAYRLLETILNAK
jgi:predicted dehydrogenase